MKIIIFRILSLLFILTGVESYAQSTDFYTENVKRIDAYIHGPIKAYNCEGGMTFPTKYKASKVRSDLSIMSFINSLFNGKTVKPDVEGRIDKVKKKSMRVVNSVNGLIESDDITLLGKYLWVNVKLDFIDNVLVRSKLILRTTTHGKCGSYTNLIDFKAIKDFFVKDAKMLFTIGYNDEITSDTIYSSNLSLLAERRKDYKFNIPGSNTEYWVNEIFTKQYQTDNAGAYNYYQAPKDFVRLIKENKIEVVKDLLFAPNYVTSVNAMEALLYLELVGKVQLTAELNNQITRIKAGSFVIMQQGTPDVLYQRQGYKELQMTDERVIKKYSSSM